MKKYKLFIVLAIGTLVLLGCDNQPGTVEGTVIHAQSGEPVVEAEIVVFELEAAEKVPQLDAYTKSDIYLKQTTDKNGAYSVSLEKGSYIIEVWVQDHEVGNRMVRVKSNRVTTIDFSVTVPTP